MKKWREKLTMALLSVSLLTLTPNAANAQSCDPCCDPCDWNFCDQCFEGGVDFLWWKPCIDDLDFAYSFKTSSGTTDVKYKDICPEWEPGVRVFLKMPGLLCDWNLGVSWTYIKSDDSSSLEAPSNGDVSSPLLHLGLLADLADSSGGKV